MSLPILNVEGDNLVTNCEFNYLTSIELYEKNFDQDKGYFYTLCPKKDFNILFDGYEMAIALGTNSMASSLNFKHSIENLGMIYDWQVFRVTFNCMGRSQFPFRKFAWYLSYKLDENGKHLTVVQYLVYTIEDNGKEYELVLELTKRPNVGWCDDLDKTMEEAFTQLIASFTEFETDRRENKYSNVNGRLIEMGLTTELYNTRLGFAEHVFPNYSHPDYFDPYKYFQGLGAMSMFYRNKHKKKCEDFLDSLSNIKSKDYKEKEDGVIKSLEELARLDNNYTKFYHYRGLHNADKLKYGKGSLIDFIRYFTKGQDVGLTEDFYIYQLKEEHYDKVLQHPNLNNLLMQHPKHITGTNENSLIDTAFYSGLEESAEYYKGKPKKVQVSIYGWLQKLKDNDRLAKTLSDLEKDLPYHPFAGNYMETEFNKDSDTRDLMIKPNGSFDHEDLMKHYWNIVYKDELNGVYENVIKYHGEGGKHFYENSVRAYGFYCNSWYKTSGFDKKVFLTSLKNAIKPADGEVNAYKIFNDASDNKVNVYQKSVEQSEYRLRMDIRNLEGLENLSKEKLTELLRKHYLLYI